jgi:hypothetical protein
MNDSIDMFLTGVRAFINATAERSGSFGLCGDMIDKLRRDVLDGKTTPREVAAQLQKIHDRIEMMGMQEASGIDTLHRLANDADPKVEKPKSRRTGEWRMPPEETEDSLADTVPLDRSEIAAANAAAETTRIRRGSIPPEDDT